MDYFKFRFMASISISALAACSFGWATQVQAQPTIASPTQANKSANLSAGGLDFANAKPLSLPQVSKAPSSQQQFAPTNVQKLFSSPGAVPGSNSGNGKLNQIQLAPVKDLSKAAAPQFNAVPLEFGTTSHPFTIERADALGDNTQYYYPYRAAGKLFFNIGTDTYVCSASLIKPGVLVTAAHCVANFGKRQFYSHWAYVPAYNNGLAPYGVWYGQQAWVMSSYYSGTDSCATSGIVCQDDVAVMTVYAGSALPGTVTGWLGYGWNGWGLNSSGQTLITQLGYPVGLDNGYLMERGDSQSYVSTSQSNNTIIGSNMNGGSSGGPWIVNFGIRPTGANNGTYPNPDTVIGVTSWGYISTLPKEQGAAPFTSGNITVLLNSACTAAPSTC